MKPMKPKNPKQGDIYTDINNRIYIYNGIDWFEYATSMTTEISEYEIKKEEIKKIIDII